MAYTLLLKEDKMKKFVVILAVFVMALFVVSCGGGNDEPADSGDTDTNNEKPADTDTDTSDSDTGAETPDTATDTDTDTNTDTEPTNEPTQEEPTDPSDPCAANPCEANETCMADATAEAGYVCKCQEGDVRVGDTACPDNPKGKLHQKCENGSWADIEGTCILCDPGDYPKVCGTYAQKMWFTSVSKLYSIDGAEGWTRTYFHIVQEQEQDKVHIKATYCNIKIDNDKSDLLAIVMPDSFAEALGTAGKESVIVKNDDGTFGFNQDVFWEIRGIDPACYGENPAEYTLPENKDDQCVQNWDNDSLPGLTVIAKGTLGGNASMGMIEKSSSKIHTGLISKNGLQINALVDWTDEQKILVVEGVNQLLKSGAQNLQQNSSKQPGFTGPFNFIEQFKIPEGSDCAYIVNNAATIFSPDPVTLK